MKAVWDRQLPRRSSSEQRRLVEVAHDCGFDTLVVSLETAETATGRSDELVRRAHDHGMRVLDIVAPYVSEDAETVPDAARQRLHPAEQAFLEAVTDDSGVYNHRRLAHHWVPPVLGRGLLCFDHPQSRAVLERRVETALERADGVAFDGFGFRNQYACFCERCRARRDARRERRDEPPAAVLRADSEATLVETSERLYAHAKSIDEEATVANHLWPPFRPNPTYGHRLELDYCSQTISWYYPPTWSLERVAFEAAEHKRLESPDRNRFVPFVGVYDDPRERRSAARLRREMEIALDHGEGNVVFSTMAPLANHEDVRRAIRGVLNGA